MHRKSSSIINRILLSVLFCLLFSLCYCQSSLRSLQDLWGPAKLFGDDRRGYDVQQRVIQLSKKDNIDTLLILENEFMDLSEKPTDSLDNRIYIIYQLKGKTLVDYIYYTGTGENEVLKEFLKRPLDEGKTVFTYFLDHRLDTVNHAYARGQISIISEKVRIFNAYINIGSLIHHIDSVSGDELDSSPGVEKDERVLFYKFVMKLLRKNGY